VKVISVVVEVGSKAATACSVNAAAVFKLEITKSMTFKGSIVIRPGLFRSFMAIAETPHKRPAPNRPAARTPRGPA
jgi:hypothetical protein